MTILVIENTATKENEDGIVIATIEEITSEFISNVAPTMVFSAVVARRFDVIDVAQALSNAGYNGSYRGIANDLPDPAAVIDDVKRTAPKIDFDVIRKPGFGVDG